MAQLRTIGRWLRRASASPAPYPNVSKSSILAALRNLALKCLRADLSGLVIATFAVQGLSYALQLALAAVLSPRDFGIVRVSEVVVGAASIFAAAGMPSMMIRLVAEEPAAYWRRLVATRVLSTVALSATLAAVGVMLMAPVLVTAEAAPFLLWLAPSIALSAIARTCISFFYGINDAKRVPRLSVPPAVSSSAVVIVGAHVFGLWGWVTGRVLGDLLLLGVTFAALRASIGDGPAASFEERLRARWLLASGVPLAVSLFARSLIDSSPVLVLARQSGASDTLGVAGLVSLIAAALTVVPGSMVTLALPSMVQLAQHDRAQLKRRLWRLVFVSVLLALPPAILGAVAAEPLARRFLPAYAPDMALAAWLLLAVPPRVLASLAGTSMLATDQVQTAFVLTLGTLAFMVLTQTLAAARWGLAGIVAATIAVEYLSAAAFLFMAHWHLRRPPPPPKPSAGR